MLISSAHTRCPCVACTHFHSALYRAEWKNERLSANVLKSQTRKHDTQQTSEQWLNYSADHVADAAMPLTSLNTMVVDWRLMDTNLLSELK